MDIRHFTQDTDTLWMTLMADIDNLVSVLNIALEFKMNFGDEGTGSINKSQFAFACLSIMYLRRPMGRKNHHRSFGDIREFLNCNRSFFSQPIHYRFVMDDFMLNVYRRTKNFQSIFHCFYRSRYSSTKSSRRRQDNFGYRHIQSLIIVPTNLFPAM